MTLALLAAAGALVRGVPQAQNPAPGGWKTPWTYDGPKGAEHWASLDPDYAACGGKQQSPIDIRSAKKADLPALRFDYKSGPLRIVNNGYTAVRVDYTHSGDFLIVADHRYELTQFHFHHPSEEYIQGKPSDMVLHLVHQDAQGKQAMVAVLLKAGRANPTVTQLWQFMPKTPGPAREIAGVQIDPAGLLPAERGYYTYTGSVTAPPCTEGVTWFVLKSPVEVSRAQIDAFAAVYPHDVRPIQPLNGRVIQESR